MHPLYTPSSDRLLVCLADTDPPLSAKQQPHSTTPHGHQMTTDSVIPSNPEEIEWDVTVIGAGMGGATIGHELARLGWKVLFLEKGKLLHGKSAKHAPILNPSTETPRLDTADWPVKVPGTTTFGGVNFFPPLGCGTGGSTTQYGAALERFTPEDFSPKRQFPAVTDSTLPDHWPISYDDLRPYYQKAEQLFRVMGTRDPLYEAGEPALIDPPPFNERDQNIYDSMQRLGLNPYKLHIACDFLPAEHDRKTRPELSPQYGLNDAGNICMAPALDKYDAKILPECEVIKLAANSQRVTGIFCKWQGKEITIKSKIVVLAAGSFHTPVLLLNSKSDHWPEGLANSSGVVGRNLMLHTSDFVAVWPTRRCSNKDPSTAIGFKDFYSADGEKLGIFETTGGTMDWGLVLGYLRDMVDRDPKWWRKITRPLLPIAAILGTRIFQNAVTFATIVEDLPYLHNRVIPDNTQEAGLRFEYHYSDELKVRNERFQLKLSKSLKPHRMAFLSNENNINYGHVCGTCRFGNDPKTSVLNKNNRSHDIENLYITDGSFFPSSSGTNPSLTIAANALRVSESVHKHLQQLSTESYSQPAANNQTQSV